jgi:hypothetical protein
MRFWELVRLALGGVRRTPLRVTLTALGVAIATGALVSMVAFAEGLQRHAERPFEELDVLSRIEVFAEKPEETATLPVLDEEALRRLREIPGVVLVYPEIQIARLEVAAGEKKKHVFASSLPRDAGRLDWVRGLLDAGRFFDWPRTSGSTILPRLSARGSSCGDAGSCPPPPEDSCSRTWSSMRRSSGSSSSRPCVRSAVPRRSSCPSTSSATFPG